MLTTPRLTIRPFVLADLEALHAIYGDPEVMRYVDGDYTSLQATRTALVNHIEMHEKDGFAFWAVERAGELVGEVGFGRLGEQVEMGWTFGRAHWGNGYATEAGEAALKRAPAAKLLAAIHPENKSSARVAEKLGFELTERSEVRGHEQLIYQRGANVRE